MYRARILAGALACAAALRVDAQTTASERARLERLRRERTRVAAIVARADSQRRISVGVDTIHVGTLTLLAPSAQGALAEQAAALAWGMLERTFGGGTAVLRPIEFVLQGPSVPDITPRVPNANVRTSWAPQGATAEIVALSLSLPAAMTITAAQDTGLQYWLRATIDVRPWTAAHWEGLYTEFVTAPWTSVRACHLGDLAACQRALGLSPAPRYLEVWYADADLEAVLRAGGGAWARRLSPGDAQACLERHDSRMCRAALSAVPDQYLTAPLSGAARVALVALALEWGGAGAYERLRAAPGPMQDRLTAAARVPIDSLVGTWRARLLAHRPASVTLRPAGAWTAFLWVVVLGVLGLRSSRWR